MENKINRICHSISSIDKNSGGTSTYLQLLVNELINYCPTTIATLKSTAPLPINPNVKLITSKKLYLSYSSGLKQDLKNIDTELFHGNGLWQYPVHAMSRAAQNRSIPYIISPHGMLEPWALNAGKWKKILALMFFQRKDLVQAACIHATAEMEAENIRKLGFKNPIAVIANGIDLNDFPYPENKEKLEKKTILFLSRIHPIKGIELMIKAWQKIEFDKRQNWQIEIAGNGEESYINSLQKLISETGFTDDIKIIGPQFGEDKLATYYRADLFVLPTYSENFGIVVAEALACGLPVITTKGTPWEELISHNAGWWIDIGVDPLAKTLQKALITSEAERNQMGLNGRKLVEENYSIASVTKKMIDLYEWVLGKHEKPDFVNLN